MERKGVVDVERWGMPLSSSTSPFSLLFLISNAPCFVLSLTTEAEKTSLFSHLHAGGETREQEKTKGS